MTMTRPCLEIWGRRRKNSDEEDTFRVRPLPPDVLPPDYQKCFLYRWHQAIHKLTSHLRDNVLLPSDPRNDEGKSTFTDVHSGMALPLWHCPFQSCATNGEAVPCNVTAMPSSTAEVLPESYEKQLWPHV